MVFEYKINNKYKSIREHSAYVFYKDFIIEIIRISILVSIVVRICFEIYNNIFEKNISVIDMFFVGFFAICIDIGIISYFKKAKEKTRKLGRNNSIEANSTFKITVDKGILTRENEFTFLQLPLNKVSDIDLLKDEVVVKFNRLKIFIPKSALSVPIDEFIETIKYENSFIKVTNYSAKINNRIRKNYVIVILTIILSFTLFFFIGKDRIYEEHIVKDEVIEEEEMVELYSSRNFGISMDVPKSWLMKCSIRESFNKIEVYYLSKGNKDVFSNFIFKIEGYSENAELKPGFIKKININDYVVYMYKEENRDGFIGSEKECKQYKEILDNIDKVIIKPI